VITRNYQQLLLACSQHLELLDQVHGVLLLACVATQSIVLAGHMLLGPAIPSYCSISLILLGVLYYVLGLSLILIRYLQRNRGCLADDWTNTNCIIHGAMSITGLTCAISRVVSPNIIASIWLWVLFTFVIVEMIEIVRAIQRLRLYGWEEGIFSYSVSQWSRNFTIGMFLAFTIKIPFHESFLSGDQLLQAVRTIILNQGPFLVMIYVPSERRFKLQTKGIIFNLTIDELVTGICEGRFLPS
jgi:hypothetical protein